MSISIFGHGAHSYTYVSSGENSAFGLLNSNTNSRFNKIDNLLSSVMNNGILHDDTGIMPPGVLAITPNFVVFERQPEYKNIFLVPKLMSEITDDSSVYTYRIPVPWQLYIVHYTTILGSDGIMRYYTNSVRMHFMKSNLQTMDQEVFMAPLPNMYGNGNLCRPMFNDMSDIDRYPNNIAGVIESAYDWVWNSGTNLDLTECIAQFYIQFKNCENTILEKVFGSSNKKISDQSYYVQFSLVDDLLSAWERNKLDEVVEFNWPRNCEAQFFRDEYRNDGNQFLVEYLQSIGEVPRYELHYDEENDSEYQCDPEYDSDCECFDPVNSYDFDEFQKFLVEKRVKKTITMRSSTELFMEETIHNQNQVALSYRTTTSEYGNIVSSVLLSS
jgi:hypothetical protein